MKVQLSEVVKLQKIAGILNEAAPSIPMPGQKMQGAPAKPPIPGQKPTTPAKPAGNVAPLDDKKKQKAHEAFFQAHLYTPTLKNNKILSAPDVDTLEHLLNKAMAAIQDHK